MQHDLRSLSCLQLSKFYPPVRGGIEAVVYELSEGLSRLEMQVEVLCANTDAKTVVDACPHPVIRAGSWGKVLSTSMSPALVWNLLKRRSRYDVIHVHLPDPMTNVALMTVRPDAKVVVHWHSDVVSQQRALKVYEPLQRWLLRRADAIIATSQRYADHSPWLQPYADKISVVPIGIRDPLALWASNRAEAIGRLRQRFAGKRIVFALGRFTAYKGFDVLVRAAGALPDDVQVIIGGSGHLADSLQRLAEDLGVEHKVHFAGAIPADELDTYQGAADIFCLPSVTRAEAFGVVLLEAMAHSRPIVATAIEGSGVPWVNLHEKTGLNVEPGNPEALADALNRLLADPDLRTTYGAAGRRRFEQEFTAQHMIDRVASLYLRLTRRPLTAATADASAL